MEEGGGGETRNVLCPGCGRWGFSDGGDGLFYCIHCGYKAEDLFDNGVADEDFVGGALYHPSHRRQPPAPTPAPASQPPLLWEALTQSLNPPKDEPHDADAYPPGPYYSPSQSVGVLGPSESSVPKDFGTPAGSRVLRYEEYYKEVRGQYVMGLLHMVSLQCEALVDEFGVSSLVYEVCGPLWLRFVAATGVFGDGWADDAIHDSESQLQGDAEEKNSLGKFSAEPRNLHGRRAVLIWYKSLRKRLPLSCSLAVSYLACHVAREPILPTDMVQWSIEGKLPYFSAFTEIEEAIRKPSSASPLSSSFMFRPSESITSQKLESLAASIAQILGLELPLVNFYGIATRYLNKLSLPVDRILPQARRIQEWSMPPDMWPSSSEKRLPTRVCVMSILIVAIRILYNINGFGVWEKSLCEDKCSSTSDGSVENPDEIDAKMLLQKLYARYYEISHVYEYTKDLPTYLQYCKDVVFAGLEPHYEDHEEKKAIRELWDFYQSNMGSVGAGGGQNRKRPRDRDECETDSLEENKKLYDEDPNDTDQSCESSIEDKGSEFGNRSSAGARRDRAIRMLKQEMEENRFVYIPPRVRIKRLDHLHYRRKTDGGAWAYVAHADYYILLRACARAAQVDIRLMHMAVLIYEKRLGWLEKRIDRCLHVNPAEISCEFCSYETQDFTEEEDAHVISLANLSL